MFFNKSGKVLKIFLVFIFTIIIILISCKSIKVKEKETAGRIIFRKLLKTSSEIKYARINGLFRIKGIDEIPSIYLKFESLCDFGDNSVYFQISTFKTPIIDIFLKDNNFYIINHTRKEFIKLNVELIDLSKITGINFNPLDLSYFFLGKIPYSESMELMSLDWTAKDLIMEITDNVSKYSITIDETEEIKDVKIYNQYFDIVFLKSIKYKADSEGIKKPSMLVFTDENNKVEIPFIIKKTLINSNEGNYPELENLIQDYNKIFKIEDLKIDIK